MTFTKKLQSPPNFSATTIDEDRYPELKLQYNQAVQKYATISPNYASEIQASPPNLLTSQPLFQPYYPLGSVQGRSTSFPGTGYAQPPLSYAPSFSNPFFMYPCSRPFNPYLVLPSSGPEMPPLDQARALPCPWTSTSMDNVGKTKELAETQLQPPTPLLETTSLPLQKTCLPTKEAQQKSPVSQECESGPESVKKTFGGNAYKRRNVYKSVVQHMFVYIKKNREEIIKVLTASGFSIRDIEHAFFNANSYNYRTQDKMNKKSAQDIINGIIGKQDIYTHILRESLNAMLKNLETGRCGKITKDNLITYKETCMKYYNETVRVLGKGAQGISYNL